MSGSGPHSGSGVGDAVRKGVGLVHGTGEAIRGNINAAVDSAAGDRQGAAKNQSIASRGVDEMEHGHYHGTGAGVTPVDTARERQNRVVQGEYDSTVPGSTNYGPHTSNTGNKLDPRFDSDLDHRGTTTGSTNYGPHGTNVGNKVDPRYDSDLDHRGPSAEFDARITQTDGTGSTNYGPHSTNLGNKLDPRYDSDLDHRGSKEGSTNYGPHDTNIGNKLDPRVDSDLDHRGPVHSSHGSTNYGPHPTNIGNKLDPRYDSDLDHRGATSGSTNYGPHHSNIANKLDPHCDSDLDHRGPGVHAMGTNESERHQPEHVHKSSILNKLDPRVDSKHGNINRDAAPTPAYASAYDHLLRETRHNNPESSEEHDSGSERESRRLSSLQPSPPPTRVLELLDPSFDTSAPLNKSHSTQNPHSSSFLNLVDPRVNRSGVGKSSSNDYA